MTTTTPTPDIAQLKTGLRMAVMTLACAPQAQRRYVQLGMLKRATGAIADLLPRLDEVKGPAALTDRQVELLTTLREEFARLQASGEDYLHEREADTRDFLFGHALEDDAWHRVRHAARACYTELRES
jgi:hypothetical protein